MLELRWRALGRPRSTSPRPGLQTPESRRLGRATAILVSALIVVAATRLIGPAASTNPAGRVGQARSAVDQSGEVAGADAGLGAAAGSPTDPAAMLDSAIATWGQKVAWDAHDYISATTLGGLYLQRARLTANLDDYDRARTAADLATSADPGYAAAAGLKASVLFAIHDFSGALAMSRALLAADPANAQALATAADSTLELGDLAGAGTLYGELTARVSGPAIDARLAHFAFLRGDAATAITLAKAARDAAVRDPSNVDPSFYDYQLGETARLTGDDALARSAYAAALAARPNDLGSLVGLARIDAYEGHVSAAIAGLRHAAAIAPQPDTLALLGDLLAAGGDAAGANAQDATVRTISQLSALAGSVYDRQLLLFELDHGGASRTTLERARDALRARPDSAGHDVVAWAAYRLGQYAEASREEDAALASGTRDARILFHAGAVDLAMGHVARGRERIDAALALGPALDPMSRAEAQRLLGR